MSISRETWQRALPLSERAGITEKITEGITLRRQSMWSTVDFRSANCKEYTEDRMITNERLILQGFREVSPFVWSRGESILNTTLIDNEIIEDVIDNFLEVTERRRMPRRENA
jgi:hypothetical protein